MDDLHTVSMHDMIQQFQGGNQHALGELIRRTQSRLQDLTAKMLAGYPNVQAHEQSDDVLQNSLLRLTRALQEVTPKSVREFYGLATQLIRRELLDLARYYTRRKQQVLDEHNQPRTEASDLEHWAALQQAIEQLPVEQREVFSLTFYHGWTQVEIAELLQLSERHVRRIWMRACLELNKHVTAGGTIGP